MGIVLIQTHLVTAAPPVRAPAATKTLAGIEAFNDQHGVFLALNHIDGSKTQIANFSGGFDPQVPGPKDAPLTATPIRSRFSMVSD